MTEDVRARFTEFMVARLTSPRAKAEWRAEIERGVAFVMASKITDFVDEKALFRAIDAATLPEVWQNVIAPAFAAGRKDVFPLIKSDANKLGAYVPEAARRAIDELLGKPGLLHEKLVAEIMSQDVVEEILRDILQDALTEFNDKVNPFFADWGLPGLIKKLVPIGGGAVLRSIESLRGEFDKRLKPETQKFLHGFHAARSTRRRRR